MSTHRSRNAPTGCGASAASAASRVTAKLEIAATGAASHSRPAPTSTCSARMNQSLHMRDSNNFISVAGRPCAAEQRQQVQLMSEGAQHGRWGALCAESTINRKC